MQDVGAASVFDGSAGAGVGPLAVYRRGRCHIYNPMRLGILGRWSGFLVFWSTL